MQRFGIVGHRALDPPAAAFVTTRSAALIDAARFSSGQVVAISALSEGADTLFAEAAVRLGVPLEIIRPFDRYADHFSSASSRRRYGSLVAAARRETRLPFASASVYAYETAMRWIADACDVLVAAWDGSPPRGTGGTADTVSYAERIGRQIVHLDVVAMRVVLRGGIA
jgi:hypothetical protein